MKIAQISTYATFSGIIAGFSFNRANCTNSSTSASNSTFAVCYASNTSIIAKISSNNMFSAVYSILSGLH